MLLGQTMLLGLPTWAATTTLHFLCLNDLANGVAVARGWSGFICANVLVNLPKSVWDAGIARNDCYGRAKFVNPLTAGVVLERLGRCLLANGPGDVRGDVDRLPPHLSMLAYAILPEGRGGRHEPRCPRGCSCTWWVDTLQELPPDPITDMLDKTGERLWPCPACGNGDLRYFVAPWPDDYGSILALSGGAIDYTHDVENVACDYALACDRCGFSVGRRHLRQCPRCHKWTSTSRFQECSKCHRTLCCGWGREIGPYTDDREECISYGANLDVCSDCATFDDLPRCLQREIEADMRGDDY